MPNATITCRTLTATPLITSASFTTALQTSMLDAGFTATPFDSYSANGANFIVYQVVNDNAKTYGTIYFRIRLVFNTNGIYVSYSILIGYQTSTHTGIKESTIVNYETIGLSYAAPIQFYAINHPEIKGVLLTQGLTTIVICLLRPKWKYSWWDENYSPWAFTFQSPGQTGALTGLNGVDTSYYPSNNTYSFPVLSTLSSDSNFAVVRSVWPMGIVLFSSGGGGIPGYFEDLRQASTYGLNLFSRIESPSQSWLVLSPGNGGVVLLSSPINVIS